MQQLPSVYEYDRCQEIDKSLLYVVHDTVQKKAHGTVSLAFLEWGEGVLLCTLHANAAESFISSLQQQ